MRSVAAPATVNFDFAYRYQDALEKVGRCALGIGGRLTAKAVTSSSLLVTGLIGSGSTGVQT